MYKVMGAKSDRTAYKPYGRRQKIGIYCTKAQKIEIEPIHQRGSAGDILREPDRSRLLRETCRRESRPLGYREYPGQGRQIQLAGKEHGGTHQPYSIQNQYKEFQQEYMNNPSPRVTRSRRWYGVNARHSQNCSLSWHTGTRHRPTRRTRPPLSRPVSLSGIMTVSSTFTPVISTTW